jgi:proteasome activator subunit 4
VYKPPHESKSTFEWESSSAEALSCLREVTVDANFWKKLSGHFAEENHENVVVRDHVSCVKSICKYHLIPWSTVVISE